LGLKGFVDVDVDVEYITNARNNNLEFYIDAL